ncbi:MAG: sulfatase-like hydrolase/transferase [Acidobacteriaceae bacterium]|nr:sulfatase-like hydrolase/transferase [Acidobacteriaceae bacterium]
MTNRRNFLTQSLAGASLAAHTQPHADKPNILHIMSDQQQWGCIGGRSPARTPNLDRLVKAGMLFDRSYTPSAVCCPARAMILSGAYHWHNGVFNQVHSSPSVHRDMFPNVTLYSQRLKDAGYRMGYVGKWHASWVRCPADFGYEMAAVHGCDPAILRKYDLNPDRVPQHKAQLRRTIQKRMEWPGSKPFGMWGYTEGPEEGTPAWGVAEAAVRMLRRYAKQSQPWLIETHFVDPHDPYFPLKQYVDHYDARSIEVPKSFYDSFEGKPGLHRRESSTWGDVKEADYRQSRACYYALVEQLDAQIGRILQALDESGQANNTLVVFTTDHGDMCGNHRMWIKGWIPYEETYRIPLVVRWPGKVQPGGRSKHLVQTHDLAHTYVAAAGAKPLPYGDGSALQPLFDDPQRSDWKDQIMNAYYGGEFLYTQRMAVTDRFKYVFNGFDIDELYDLERDPEEMRNVAADASYAKYADDMRARLYEMMARFEDPYGLPARWTLPGQPPDRYGAPRYLSRGKRL